MPFSSLPSKSLKSPFSDSIGNDFQARPGYWLQGQLSIGESQGIYRALKICLRAFRLGNFSLQNELRRNQFDSIENNFVPPEVGDSVIASQSELLSRLFNIRIRVLSISEYEKLKPVYVTDKNGMNSDGVAHGYKPLVSRVLEVQNGVPTYVHLIHCSVVEDDKLLERAIKWCFSKKWQDDHPESKLVKNIRRLCATSLAGFNGAGSVDSFIDNLLSKMISKFVGADKRSYSIRGSIKDAYFSPPIPCEIILKNYEKSLRNLVGKTTSEADIKKRLKEDLKLISSAYIVAYVEYGSRALRRSNVPFFVHATRFADIVSKSDFAPDAQMVAAALLSRVEKNSFLFEKSQKSGSDGSDAIVRSPDMTFQQKADLLAEMHLRWVRRDVVFGRKDPIFCSARDFLLETKKHPYVGFYVEKLRDFRMQSFIPYFSKNFDRPDYSARWWSDALLLRAWERVEEFFSEKYSASHGKELAREKKEVCSGLIMLTLGETLQRVRNSARSRDNKSITDLTTLLVSYTAERIGANEIASKLRFAVHRLNRDEYNTTKRDHTEHLGISEIASSSLQKTLTNKLRTIVSRSNIPCSFNVFSRVKGYYSSHEKKERELIEGLKDGILRERFVQDQHDLIGLTCLVEEIVSLEGFEKLRHLLITSLGPITIDCHSLSGIGSRIDVVSSDDKSKGIVFQRTNFNLDILLKSILEIYEQEFHLLPGGSIPERALRVLNAYQGELRRDVLKIFVHYVSPELLEEQLQSSDFAFLKCIENVLGRERFIDIFSKTSSDNKSFKDILLGSCSPEEQQAFSEIFESHTSLDPEITFSRSRYESYILNSRHLSFWSILKETLDLTLLGGETHDELVGKIYRALKVKCGVFPENPISSDALYKFLVDSTNRPFTFALHEFFEFKSKKFNDINEIAVKILIQLGMGPRFEIQITDKDNHTKGKHNNSPAKYQNAHANLKVRDEWMRKMLIMFLQTRYHAESLHTLSELAEATLSGYPERIAETSRFVNLIYDRHRGQQFDRKDPKMSGSIRDDTYALMNSLALNDNSRVFVVELPSPQNQVFGEQFPVKLPCNSCVYDLLSHVKTHEAIGESKIPHIALERFDESSQRWSLVPLSEKLRSLDRIRVRKSSARVYEDVIPDSVVSVSGRLARRVHMHINSVYQASEVEAHFNEAVRSARDDLFLKLGIDKKYLSEEFIKQLENSLLNYTRQFGLSNVQQVFLAMYYNIAPVTFEQFKNWCHGNFVTISSHHLIDNGGYVNGFDIVVDEEQVGLLQKILAHPLLHGINLESASISRSHTKEVVPQALQLRFSGDPVQLDQILKAVVTNLPYMFIGRGNGHITIFPKRIKYELILEDEPGVLNKILGVVNSYNISIADIQTSEIIPGTRTKKVLLALDLPESQFSPLASTNLLKFNPVTTIEPLFGLHSLGFKVVDDGVRLPEKDSILSNIR